MKKFFIVVLCAISISNLMAQTPNAFQYQAVVRDDQGSILVNTEVKVRVKIHQGSMDGVVVYQEEHEASTTKVGTINLRIGSGLNTTVGNRLFSDIEWATNSYFIEVELDKGLGYTTLGTQQLLSVPYAKYANNANNVHIKSPNGQVWSLTIDNNGTLSAQKIIE